MNKLLDIVTINYNNLEGLKKTYYSIQLAEHESWVNWIVIDGGSDDGSVDFIKNLPIAPHYWQSEKDKGIYDAMNIGLSHSKAEYIWFLNSGDLVHDERTLTFLHDRILKKQSDLFYSDTTFIDEEGKVLGLRSNLLKKPVPDKLQKSSFIQGMNVGHQSIILKRSRALNYDLSYKHVADIDWVIRVLSQDLETHLLNFYLSKFEIGGHSSQNKLNAMVERFWVLNKHYGFLNNLLSHLKIFLKV